MKQPFDASAIEGELRRVRELLESHTARGSADVTETVDGVVSVTIDAQLQVASVKVLDAAIDPQARATLEQSLIEAINRAMLRVVRSSAEALKELQRSPEWQRAAAGVGQALKDRTP